LVAEITAGSPAPVVNTPLVDAAGETRDISQALAHGPVLLSLYKSSCQASKTMFPFLERLHQRYAGTSLTVLGVSQDSPMVTASFGRRAGVTFPIIIEPEGYPVATAYGITCTPTVFLILPDGTVSYTTMGFFKDPVNELGDAVAAAVGQPPSPLVTEDDTDVPVFVPG